MPPGQDPMGATSTSSSSSEFPAPIARSEPATTLPISTPLPASALMPFVLPRSKGDDVDHETVIEADHTMSPNHGVGERGLDDYAIESLASSIMEDSAEATTETFYIGKCKC
ncbi:hypothetical protein ONZ43_g326 [Nemania bipapillata]|uniref:Uncharacterized protein n=1 Tax=Nemania bipapillata TaxID=110536 RepID=A0ACC2J8P8_9PEZI|nr:hypothetical protein ONZ43_g326 [Nemania bipapillata]